MHTLIQDHSLSSNKKNDLNQFHRIIIYKRKKEENLGHA
jgi:hypothetical protein